MRDAFSCWLEGREDPFFRQRARSRLRVDGKVTSAILRTGDPRPRPYVCDHDYD